MPTAVTPSLAPEQSLTDSSPLTRGIEQRLAQRQADQLYRQRRVLQGAQGVQVVYEGKTLLSFCSNDYLGLANDPRVVAAFKAGVDRYGLGSGASHLITGHSAAHHALEEALAEFVGAARALVFSTGYMANLSALSLLENRCGHVFADRLNHASLIDAVRQGKTQVSVYPHRDMHALSSALHGVQGEKLILTDGVFSMEGDEAPLAELLQLAHTHQAWLWVDDAHGLGVLGDQGRGSLAQQGIPLSSPLVLMGTLGKAFGSFGAFVAGDEAVIETLIQHARPYIYTTALPPAVAEATCTSLALVRAEDWRRERLHDLVQHFRHGAAQLGLDLLPSATPIQAVLCGEPAQALTASEGLEKRGLLVTAIRPPTVPPHTARLRITFSAGHSVTQVDQLLEGLAAVLGPG